MRSMKNLNLAISMAVAVLANATLADGHEIKFLDAAEGADGSNPIIKKVFTPDPAAVVDGDTLYLFTGHDEPNARGYYMKDWFVFKTTNMVDWVSLGNVLDTSAFAWARQGNKAWASQAVKRGVKWYWYVAVQDAETGKDAIGVAVADKPEGPWTDGLGRSMVPPTNGFIDPTVFVDEDGTAWMFWGNCGRSPGLWYAPLKENMVELAADFEEVPGIRDEAAFGKRVEKGDRSGRTSFTEAPWIYKHDGVYYLEYACDFPERWAYSTAPTVHGPWTYRGRVMDTGVGTRTVHGGSVFFKGQWYMVRHDATLPGGGDCRRSTCIEPYTRNSDGSIPFIPNTVQGCCKNKASVQWTTTEGGAFVQTAVVPATNDDAEELFETDGVTAREGSMPWRAWGTTFNELDLDALKLLKEEEREEIMAKLFSPDGDLRFTRGRLVMNANDYSREWYSCSEVEGDFELKHFNIEHDKTNQIALVRMAQKYQPKLTFWMSPWSPPAWMKINKDYCVVSSKFNNQPKEKDALLFGGDTEEIDPNEMWLQGNRKKAFPRRLASQNYFIQEPRYLQAYADMFAKFVQLYKAEGVPIDMVMYQNEAYSYTPYPGCPWTAEGTVRFNRDYLAPTLKAKCPGVRLYLGTINTNRRGYIEQIVDAPGVLDCIDGFGFQWEGREIMESVTDKYAGKHRICSESECGNGQMDWRAAEHTSWLIFRNLAHGADEWYNWNFILCDQGRSPWGWKQNALIRVRSANRTYSCRPEYYAVKHFSHFIKPGAVQLAYSPWKDKVKALCYRNPDGGIVVVMTNWADVERRVSFKVAGKFYSLALKPHSFNTVTL